MRPGRLALLAPLLLLATGCGGVEDLPDAADFRDCLEAAGADADALDDADARAQAFADPGTLDCVTALNAGQQRDTLQGVFTTPDLADALVAWIALDDGGAEVEARTVGSLAGAGGDPEDSDVTGGLLDEYLAWAVYADSGADTQHDAWLDDPAAQDSVPQADPLAGPSLYLDWLEDRGDDRAARTELSAIRELASQVADRREAAAP